MRKNGKGGVRGVNAGAFDHAHLQSKQGFDGKPKVVRRFINSGAVLFQRAVGGLQQQQVGNKRHRETQPPCVDSTYCSRPPGRNAAEVAVRSSSKRQRVQAAELPVDDAVPINTQCHGDLRETIEQLKRQKRQQQQNQHQHSSQPKQQGCQGLCDLRQQAPAGGTSRAEQCVGGDTSADAIHHRQSPSHQQAAAAAAAPPADQVVAATPAVTAVQPEGASQQQEQKEQQQAMAGKRYQSKLKQSRTAAGKGSCSVSNAVLQQAPAVVTAADESPRSGSQSESATLFEHQSACSPAHPAAEPGHPATITAAERVAAAEPAAVIASASPATGSLLQLSTEQHQPVCGAAHASQQQLDTKALAEQRQTELQCVGEAKFRVAAAVNTVLARPLPVESNPVHPCMKLQAAAEPAIAVVPATCADEAERLQVAVAKAAEEPKPTAAVPKAAPASAPEAEAAPAENQLSSECVVSAAYQPQAAAAAPQVAQQPQLAAAKTAAPVPTTAQSAAATQAAHVPQQQACGSDGDEEQYHVFQRRRSVGGPSPPAAVKVAVQQMPSVEPRKQQQQQKARGLQAGGVEPSGCPSPSAAADVAAQQAQARKPQRKQQRQHKAGKDKVQTAAAAAAEDDDDDDDDEGVVFHRRTPLKQRQSHASAAAIPVQQQQQQLPVVGGTKLKRRLQAAGTEANKRGSSITGSEQPAEVRQQSAQQEPVRSKRASASSLAATASSLAGSKAAAAAAAAAGHVPRRRRSASVVAAVVEDGDAVDVAAVVAAAQLPVLVAASAVLRSGDSESRVKPQDYYIGDRLTKRDKLFIKDPGGVDWVQRSKSCHDCQMQHIHYKCNEPGCRGLSICNTCLVNRYHGLHSLADLHTRCPVCRGECTCRSCLRKADHHKLLPMPEYSQQQRQALGACSLLTLGPLLASFMDQQNAEAVAWGYAGGLRAVPRHPLAPSERLLCDRCATHVVGLVAHCPSCGWDCCSTCAATLRQHSSQPATAGRANGRAKGSAAVTCCNPECPSVVGETSGSPGEQCVVRGELMSLPGAAELSLEAVLPADILKQLDKLQQLAQEYRSPRALQLSDCPLLPAGAAAQLLSPPGVPLTLEQLQADNWWSYLPQHIQGPWRRRVTSSSWMFTPHIRDLTGDADIPEDAQLSAWGPRSGWKVQQGHLALAVFWARWQLGEPVIVRGVTGRLKWDPATLRRAVRDIRAERAKQKQRGGSSVAGGRKCGSSRAESDGAGSDGDGSDSDDDDCRVMVLDCEDFSRTSITEHEFFAGYKHGYVVERRGPAGGVQNMFAMLKVKDWPPRSQLKSEMQRHYLDFLEALPVRQYTDPRLGYSPLNLASALVLSDNPTDLGPKCYVAYGRVAEAQGEGDSVTKLHVDMADAVNLLLHTEPGADPQARTAAAAGKAVRCGNMPANKPSYDGAGAVWDICPRGAATQQLSQYLRDNAADFIHQGEPVSAEEDNMVNLNPIFTQKFMLVERHRQQLLAQQGVEMWHFEQHRGEAVFIPGGCPHQVRNLQSCCKVAVDFVSPESMSHALANREQLRMADLAVQQELDINAKDRHYQEKLGSTLMLLRGALRAADLLAAGTAGRTAESKARGRAASAGKSSTARR